MNMTSCATEGLQILLVNPANDREQQPATFPNLGLLTIGTSLSKRLRESESPVRVLYYDGALHGDAYLHDYIHREADQILAIGFSSYTLNFGACVDLASWAKRCNRRIINVIGNDHFSALWSRILARREAIFDYGFCGNDVVEGFSDFMKDLAFGRVRDLASYSGLAFRDPQSQGSLRCNPEKTEEYVRLPLIDYALLDSMIPHARNYLAEQCKLFPYIREGGLRATVIDIARGCLKFVGPRSESGIPVRACDFCAIIPGAAPVVSVHSGRAWEIIHNAVQKGYNYLYLTADEFPTTFWSLARAMADKKPEWYLALAPSERPRIMCYALADAFGESAARRLDVLMGTLGCDHFFFGLEAFTETSLRAMNKPLNPLSSTSATQRNLRVCNEISLRGGRVTAGLVLTHLGITPEIMKTNFEQLKQLLERYGSLFTAVNCELLIPTPGSQVFDYMRYPGTARAKAEALGLQVDERYLKSVARKYGEEDLFDSEELVQDFIRGCCPEITVGLAYEYLDRTQELTRKYGVVYEGKLPA